MWKWPEYETLCSKDAKGSLEQSSQLILYKYTSFLSWFNMYLYEFTFNWSVYCLEFSSKYLRMQFKKNFTFNLELKKNMYNLVNVSVFCIMICCSYIETRLMHLYCIKKCLPLVSFFILWCCERLVKFWSWVRFRASAGSIFSFFFNLVVWGNVHS